MLIGKAMYGIHVEDELRCGELIGESYILGDVLGVGGMGIVYGAVQRSLGRAVAVKMPRTDVSAKDVVQRRFHTEALVASTLRHRHVVNVIDFGSYRSSPFLVMERVEGHLLGRIVRKHGALEPALAAELVAQVLDALDAAHEIGIVHADVKPDNVFVEQERDVPFARLFDFGVARIIDREPAADNGLLYGTPEYIAPELIRGQRPSPASDIYAAGVMLFELLTAKSPFGGGESHEVLARHLQMEATPPSRVREDGDVSAQLDAITLCALEKRPAARFGSARAFAGELRACARIASGSGPHRVAPLGIDTTKTLDDDILLLARSLIDQAQPQRAAAELEQAVQLLCEWTNAGTPPRSIWCIYVTLAALYAHLGDRERARRLAHVGYHQAVVAGSRLGEERARMLLARIGATAAAGTRDQWGPLLPTPVV